MKSPAFTPLLLSLGSSVITGMGCSYNTIDLGSAQAMSGGSSGSEGGAQGGGGIAGSSGGGGIVGSGGNGQGGGGIAGSGGGEGGCIPDSIAPCYDGPVGTEGQGNCKNGLKTCNVEGSAFGPCIGEVTPEPEDCATPVDEDCDGLAPSCKGNLLWSKRFGDAGEQSPYGLAVDKSGNVLVTGYFAGTIDFGGGPLVSSIDGSIFLVKLDTSGSHIWSKSFGDMGNPIAFGVAADSTNSAIITGALAGSANFGGGTIASAGGSDIFVAKMNASGSHLWSKRFGDVKNQHAYRVVTDSADNVLLTGSMEGKVDFGGGSLSSAGGEDVFVAKLDLAGAHLWSKRFGDGSDQYAYGIATNSADDVLVAGTFDGTMNFGGGSLASIGTDAFVAKLDAGGAYLWSKRFGDMGSQSATAIATDGAGAAYVAGNFTNVINFGDKALVADGPSAFIVKLDASSAHVWSKGFSNSAINSIATDGSGNVYATGAFSGEADFGGGPFASAGGSDIFIVKLDALGEHQWSKRFGDVNASQVGTCVAANATGEAFLAGLFSGQANFGEGPLTSAGADDVFVAKFSP